MLEVVSKTTIHANREQAWAVLSALTDFDSWNPIVRHVDGALAEGSTITIHVDGPAGARPWDVTVGPVDPGRALGWHFKERAGWLYRGEHVFSLEDSPHGVVLVDQERFWGLLVPLRASGLRRRIEASMADMGTAFKRHLEGLARAA